MAFRSNHVVRAAASKVADFFGARGRISLPAADAGGRVLGQVLDLPAGLQLPAFCHGGEDKVLYVLGGAVSLATPNAVTRLDAGDMALVPRGLIHQVTTNEGSAQVLILFAPGQLEPLLMNVDLSQASRAVKDELSIWGVEMMERIEPYAHPISPRPGPLRVIRADEGEPWWVIGGTFTIKVSGSETDNAFCLIHFRVPPGGGPVAHIHRGEEEIFHLLRGSVEFYASGDTVAAGVGDTAVLPRHLTHTFRNPRAEHAEMLGIITPAGFDNFVRRIGVPAIPGRSAPAPDEAEILRILEGGPVHRIEFLPEVVW